MTNVRVIRKKESPRRNSNPLAICHRFAKASNRRYSLVIRMIVFGVRVRHTWFKSPTLSQLIL